MTWHAQRGLRALEGSDGPVLGLDRLDPPTEAASVALAPDELVVLVSDGVLERVVPGRGPIGERGLAAALDAMERPSAAAAVSAVLQAVAAADGAPLRDDASVLVLAPR
jgi:serine phosphatase RsbU (regulator of sigma subunit)